MLLQSITYIRLLTHCTSKAFWLLLVPQFYSLLNNSNMKWTDWLVTLRNFLAQKVSVFEVEVFWIVMQWNVVVGYQRFRGPWCLHFTTTLRGVTTQTTST